MRGKGGGGSIPIEKTIIKEPYTILIMKTDGDLQRVGSITSSGKIRIATIHNINTSGVAHNISINDIPINFVNRFNRELVRIIAEDNLYGDITRINRPKKQFPISMNQIGDINGYIYKILRYRHCTIYLVYQTSSIGIRYLAYFSDKVAHSSNALGNSGCSTITKDTIISEIAAAVLLNRNKFINVNRAKIAENFGI